MYTRRSVVAIVALCSLFMVAWLLPHAAASEEGRGPARSHAEMALGADRIDWQPAGDYEQVVLTVAGPEGLWFSKEFDDGQPPSLSLSDEEGHRLPDGAYVYELRLVQQKVGPLSEQPVLQAGSFAVRNGSFATPFESAKPPKEVKTAQEPAIKNTTATAQVIADDLVVQGNACIGSLCGSGDASGATLKLKQSTFYGPSILFEDPFDQITPDRDWKLQTNASGSDHFFLGDIDAGTTPFVVWGGSPDYSLVVGSGGKIGIGTAIPSVRLDVKASAAGQATERLQNSSASGYSGTEYLDHAGNVDLFFGVDNAASTTRLNSFNNNPIVVLTNSTERMRVTSDGKVGLGTANPADKLHLFDNADVGTVVRIENSSSGVNAHSSFRTQSDTAVVHFRAHGSGRTISRFGVVLGGWSEIVQDIGNGLAIGTQNSTPIILGTNNTNRLQINGSTGAVTVSGNLTVNGTFSNPSSRLLKEGFEPLDPKTVLDKFARLPIQEWSYKSDDRKLRHVGPTVEDFQASFGLGTEGQYIFPMDVQGVTMTAVQGLYQVVQEKDAEISALRGRLAALEELVAKLAAPR